MHKIRILLVDDHTLMRTGVRMVLQAEPDMEVVGEASDGDAGVRMAEELRPDVVLMDLSMPGTGGLEATRRVTAAGHDTRVLVLTMHGEEEYLVPVLEAGGSGYVTKQSADTDLVEAVRVVARGDVFLYPSAATVLTRSLRTPRQATPRDDTLHLLSPREREVLTLTAEGYSSTEIGDQLHLSHKTVETYRQRLMDKLDLHHRSELVRFALTRGLLQAAATAA